MTPGPWPPVLTPAPLAAIREVMTLITSDIC